MMRLDTEFEEAGGGGGGGGSSRAVLQVAN